MEIESTFIEGLKLINYIEIKDDRGSFLKVFNSGIFNNYSLKQIFHEQYFTSSKKNVLRGMHFQVPPFEYYKLVTILSGEIIDVIVDLRKKSATYGKVFSIKLSRANNISIYIPSGCAHGFLTLKNNTMLSYLQTTVYSNDFDTGIKFDSIDFDWGIKNPIISKRDLSFSSLRDFKSPF